MKQKKNLISTLAQALLKIKHNSTRGSYAYKLIEEVLNTDEYKEWKNGNLANSKTSSGRVPLSRK